MEISAVARVIAEFDDPRDGSAEKSRELILHLLKHTATPFSREQFTPGHITCTGLALHPSEDAILLVHHRRLGRWLLPGGHVETEDAEIWDAARRETLEETGVALSEDCALVGLDVHGIPPKRGEPFHLHHDLIVGFRATSESTTCSPESRAVAWCAPAEFDAFNLPQSIRLSYARALAVFERCSL